MANKHIKRWSMWLVIKEMQVKTIMRYQDTYENSYILKMRTTPHAGEDADKLYPLPVGTSNGTATLETLWQFL